ncbi:tetratricopeptide repeat protein [Campylobacter sp.]|uniref:tetratricopeptide repeat protein n=1 Tax=Campylobacter sp. TaxID=205 RepID=UPI002708C609|nr:hypothetical protein [Campylobacter sp.]
MYRNKAFIGAVIWFFLSAFSLANEKISVDENLYILQALMAVDNAKHDEAMAIYKKLYDETKKPAYLKEALKFAFFTNSKEFDKIMQLGEKTLKDDTDFLRIKGASLMNSNRLEEAKKVMQTLIKKENKPRNHIMLGSILSMQGDNEGALNQFKIVYENDKNDDNLLRIAEFLYNKMDRKDEAVSYLETSRRINGCSVHVCLTLTDLYTKTGKLNNTIEIYEDLYRVTKEKEYLDKAVGVYVYQKNYEGAVKFLQKHSHNDNMLMEIWAIMGEFDKAYKKAKELFDKSFNLEYQAKMAIYQYERDSKNLSKDSLDQIIHNFEKSAVKLDEPIYLNYYGYLLIDHDVDVKKGIELVEKALAKEPNSVYYLDSLAWGLYKIGECERAKEIMEKTMYDEEFINSSEAKEHIRLINECAGKKSDTSKAAK